MIFHLLYITFISTIIVQINSMPSESMSRELVELIDVDNDIGSLQARYPPFENIRRILRRIREETDAKFRTLENNTSKIIDSGSVALQKALDKTNKNIKNTINPIKNALQANLKALQKMREFIVNIALQIPEFGIDTAQQYSNYAYRDLESFED